MAKVLFGNQPSSATFAYSQAMEGTMLYSARKAAVVVGLFTLSLAACQTGTVSGATGGAVAGAVVGGPVGAVVGGAAGAAVGATLSPEQSTRVRQYVVTQRRPSVRVAEEVVIGEPLPPRVRLYPVPASVDLETSYSYTVVNGQTVLVDPSTREVVEIIQ